jgi:hypothetical protein
MEFELEVNKHKLRMIAWQAIDPSINLIGTETKQQQQQQEEEEEASSPSTMPKATITNPYYTHHRMLCGSKHRTDRKTRPIAETTVELQLEPHGRGSRRAERAGSNFKTEGRGRRRRRRKQTSLYAGSGGGLVERGQLRARPGGGGGDACKLAAPACGRRRERGPRVGWAGDFVGLVAAGALRL